MVQFDTVHIFTNLEIRDSLDYMASVNGLYEPNLPLTRANQMLQGCTYKEKLGILSSIRDHRKIVGKQGRLPTPAV